MSLDIIARKHRTRLTSRLRPLPILIYMIVIGVHMIYGSSGYPRIIFQSAIGRQKPNTIRDDELADACPFCDLSQLPPVIRRDGDIILVRNKYPILKNSDPYVLIETRECASELSLYPADKILRVFRMAFDFWNEMLDSGSYRSIMFIKNHGPFSGGSLRHPHTQLIGLYDINCEIHLREESFYGPVIYRQPGIELNISDSPRVGFVEFNILLTDAKAFDAFCLAIQKAVRFVLREFQGGRINSYNLFFHRFGDLTACTIMPRGATTPIFLGYSIPQVADNLDEIARTFRKAYFS